MNEIGSAERITKNNTRRKNEHVYILLLKLVLIHICVYFLMKNFSCNSFKGYYSIFRHIESTTCVNELINEGRSYEDIDLNLNDCFFSRLSSISNNGGVIYVNTLSRSMNVFKTMFFNCSSNNEGGAIYFNSFSIIMRMICAFRCSALKKHFAFLKATQNNTLDYVSISTCSHSKSGEDPFRINSGSQRLNNCNVSINNANTNSGFCSDSSSSVLCILCNFANNRVGSHICIYLYLITGLMSFSNIVHNNSPSYGIIYSHGVGFKLEYCILSMNENILFHHGGNTLEISHCFVFHSGNLGSTSVITSNNNSFVQKHTYQVHFFQSHFCNADFQTSETSPTIPRTYDENPFGIINQCSRETRAFSVINIVFTISILMSQF